MARLVILYLCSLTLRSLVLAAIAGLVTLRMRNVVGRHAVWTAVLGCMLLMPVADGLLPASLVPARAPQIVLPVQTFVPVVPPAVSIQPFAAVAAPVPEPARWDWWQVAACAWFGLGAAFLLRLVLACGAVMRIKRTGQTVSSELIASHEFAFRTPRLRESGDVMIPLTVGLWKPVLILPRGWRDWDDWKLRAVLAHELTHVRRMDWAIAVTATLVRCVFWFNPLSWWLERHLSSLAEQASDEASVQATGDAPRYAETLLQFASAAKHGRRWTGGVAMAQYKISSRIESVLRLQKAGSGVLSRAGWIAVCVLAIPALYVSAAAQLRTTTQMPTLTAAEIVRIVQQSLPLPEQSTVTPTQQPAQRAQQLPFPGGATVNAGALTPTASAGILRYYSAWAPSAQQPQAPPPNDSPVPPPAATPVIPGQGNPDLVGEIRLILAPVDQAPGAAPGQVELQLNRGAVWNVRNGALNPNSWTRNVSWPTNGNAFTFAMTNAQGRTLSFETSQGGTFSYGCPDCSFLASESGVAALSGNTGTGIIFRLSNDGKSVTATCRAVQCLVGSPAGTRSLKDSETMEFATPQQPPLNSNNPGLRCLSVFGNVKADGTPLTAADCPGGMVVTPSSVMFFAVTR